MITEDIEYTNDQEYNDSANTGANFVDPQKYLDDKSARISVKEGKTIYEIEIPFGIEDYREVSKEEYDQYVQETKAAREESMKQQQDINEQRQKHNKKLQDIGYLSNNGTRGGDAAYESRILQILENKNLETIKQIAGYVEEGTKENQIQLFQTLAKKEKAPDFYEKSISDFLDKYEPIIENIFIGEDEITRIGQLFVIGCIDDIQLFYRFEELKCANRRNQYKRIYLFGKDKKSTEHVSEEKEFLQDNDMRHILYFLEHMGGTIRDLDDDENRFRTKVKASYIHELKESRLGRGRAWFGNRDSGFEQKKLTRTLGFTDEDFRNWKSQAEKDFANEFSHIVTHMDIDTISFSLTNLQENITRIGQSTDTSKLRESLCMGLQACITQGIQKILDKEKITVCTWNERKNLSYKKWIKNMSEYIDSLYTELEKLDSNAAKDTGWQEKKDSYIQEYCDFHRNTFIQKRLLTVLKADISDKEAIEKQLLHDVTSHFYLSCKKKIEKKGSDTVSYNPLSTRMIIQYMIDAFFKTGYALVLKTIYPDDEERKALRQGYVQTITKNILSDINTRLSNLSTFSLTEYHMREPMNYLHQKYGGKENLLDNQKIIKEKYQQHLELLFEKEGSAIIQEIAKTHTAKKILDIHTAYNHLTDFTVLSRKYIGAMIPGNSIIRPYIELEQILLQNTQYNEKNAMRYPDSMINDFSFQCYLIENIETYLPPNLFSQCIDWYTKIDTFRPKVIQTILQGRLAENGQVGGKLQRLSQEIIIKEFGVLTLSKEQIDFLLQYFTEHLSTIILQDLALSSDGIDLFWSDKELVKTYIEKYMEAFKNNIALLANEQKYFKKNPL